MERPDGKNPFDPETYTRPAANILTMLELRAFCADFFDRHVRASADTDQEDIANFLALITHSSLFFARARAVIPELQAPDVESSHPNVNVQVLLHATRGMRGPPGEKWEFLPEEPAWTKLAKDGMENSANDLTESETGHEKQPCDASAHNSAMVSIAFAPGEVEYKSAKSPPHSPVSVKSEAKPLPKKLDLSKIPTFVPQNAMGPEELVWSPTSGTRPRRPDEIYQQSTEAEQSAKARPANPTQFGQEISPNVSSAYNLKNQYLFHGSRDFSDTPTGGHRHSDSLRISPPPQFKRTQSPLNPSASQFKGPRYPSSQARGVYGAEPFSAPPSVPGYGNLHQTGQGMYGGPPSPFQNQLGPFQSGSDAASSFHPFAGQVPYAPNPEIWAPQPRRGALPNQMADHIIQPAPQRMTQARIPPSMMAQAQIPRPLMTKAPNSNETLVVPPPGSLDPLEHWNLLYQRETEIRARLHNANRPMTDQERQYISLLAEARVNAVATQLPVRGGASKGKWLAELGRTQRSIWKTGPGGMGFPPVIVARKMDFETAVEREINLASQQERHGRFPSALDRAYGA